MKQKTKQLTKLVVLIFSISLLVWNCERDDNFKETIGTTIAQDNFKIKRVTLEEIKQDSRLSKTLSNIEKKFDYTKDAKNKNSRITATDDSFVILTDEILQTNTDSIEAYTFRIETPTHSDSAFENFVIEKQNGDDYKFFIYRFKNVDLEDYVEPTYSISREVVTENQINLGDFLDLTNMWILMDDDGCLYDMTYSAEGIHVLFIGCLGGGGSTEGSTGSGFTGNNGGYFGDGSNSDSSNGGTGGSGSSSGGSSSSSTIGVIPSPFDISFNNFIDQLTDDQVECMSSHFPLQKQIRQFLEENYGLSITYSAEDFAEDFAEDAIDSICDSTNSINTFQDALLDYTINNLSISEIAEFNWYEDTSPLGIDVRELMNCFNNIDQTTLSPSSTFSITVYIEQPVPNTTETYSGTDPGHTFVSMNINDPSNPINNITQTFGYYPATSVNPVLGNNTANGEFRDNSGHNYHVSATTNLNLSDFYNLVNFVDGWGNSIPQYNLETNNCTDFGIQVGNFAGMSLPDTTGSWSVDVPLVGEVELGSGSNPGNLGQDVRALNTLNVTVNATTGSSAPSGYGTCN